MSLLIGLMLGLQNTARGPNPARETISSIMKKYWIYKKFVDFVECNIFRKNHIM